jgi:hypothetical protein
VHAEQVVAITPPPPPPRRPLFDPHAHPPGPDRGLGRERQTYHAALQGVETETPFARTCVSSASIGSDWAGLQAHVSAHGMQGVSPRGRRVHNWYTRGGWTPCPPYVHGPCDTSDLDA